MAYTLNRRLAELIDSNGQLQSGKISNGYISTAHFANNSITQGKLHSTFALPASALTARDTGDLSEGSNLYYTDARVGTYISGDRTYGNITTTGYIAGPATFTIDPAAVGDNTGTVVIAGNLQVDGTTTTINSTTITVDDLNLTLASGASNSSAANGAGLTIDGASATMLYTHATTSFDFNKPVKVTGAITASGGLFQTERGSASAPTFTFSDDTDTGMYNDSNADLGFTVGGTERMRIDSSGDVRFAANATGGALIKSVSGNQVDRNSGGYPQFTFVGNEGTGMRRVSSNVLAFDTSGDEAMRITSAGNVGIGVVPSNAKLEVVASSGEVFRADAASGAYRIVANQSGVIMNGNVGIGTAAVTSPGLWYDATNDYLAISHWATPPTPAAMLHLSDNSNDLDVPQIRVEGRENPGDTKLDIAVKDPTVRFNLVENNNDAANGFGKIIFKTNSAANTTHPTRGGFHFETAAQANALVITNTATVGIGTSSPQTALDVRGEISVDYNATYGLRFYNQPRNNWSSIGNTRTNSSANLVFKDSTGQVMEIGDGKIYIGTASNGSGQAVNAQNWIHANGLNLDIKGNDDVRFLGDAGTVIGRFTYQSRLAVGADAPVVPLDIQNSTFGLPNTSGTGANGMVRIGYVDRTWGGNEMFLGIINDSSKDYAGYIQCKVPTNQATYRPLLLNPQGGGVVIGRDTNLGSSQLTVSGTGSSQILIYETGATPYTATLKLASQSVTAYGANVEYDSNPEELTIENFGRALNATSTSGSIRFRTKVGNSSMQEVMRLQGYTGAVTQPYQPTAIYTHVGATEQGAYGYDYGTSTGSVNVYMKPQSAVVNRGNLYNTSTGAFTAPVAGVYRYGVHGNLYTAGIASNAFWAIRILKNGSHYIYHYESNSINAGGGWKYVNAGGLIEMATNDYIMMQLISNNKAVNNIHFGWDLSNYTHYEFQLLY